MANPTVPISAESYVVYMADVATAGNAYVVVDREGVISGVSGVLYAAQTVASSAVTFSRNGTVISGMTATVTASAAGTRIDATVPRNVRVAARDVLAIISDGAGTGPSPMSWTIQLRPDLIV
jgi:hypothetical protein